MGMSAVVERSVAMASVRVPANGEMSGTEVMLVLNPDLIAPTDVSKNAITAMASFANGAFVCTENAWWNADVGFAAAEVRSLDFALEAMPFLASLSHMKPVMVWKAHQPSSAGKLSAWRLREVVLREKELSNAREPSSRREL